MSRDFKYKNYEEMTPAQRWAMLCIETREKSGMSGKDFCKTVLGVTENTLVRYEKGEFYPKNEKIHRLAVYRKQSPLEIIAWLDNTIPVNQVEPTEVDATYKVKQVAAKLSDKDLAQLVQDLMGMIVARTSNNESQLSLF